MTIQQLIKEHTFHIPKGGSPGSAHLALCLTPEWPRLGCSSGSPGLLRPHPAPPRLRPGAPASLLPAVLLQAVPRQLYFYIPVHGSVAHCRRLYLLNKTKLNSLMKRFLRIRSSSKDDSGKDCWLFKTSKPLTTLTTKRLLWFFVLLLHPYLKDF